MLSDLQILKELHPFIESGNWFTSESLKKTLYFNEPKVGFTIYSRLSNHLIVLYTNGYLERKDRKKIFFKKRGISFRGKYVYKLKTRYQSLPKNQLKLTL